MFHNFNSIATVMRTLMMILWIGPVWGDPWFLFLVKNVLGFIIEFSFRIFNSQLSQQWRGRHYYFKRIEMAMCLFFTRTSMSWQFLPFGQLKIIRKVWFHQTSLNQFSKTKEVMIQESDSQPTFLSHTIMKHVFRSFLIHHTNELFFQSRH